MYPPKLKRNKEIVKLKDKNKWTFAQIAKEFNITKQTAHEIYHNEKQKSQELSEVRA